MRKYESVVVYNPELSEEKVQEAIKRVESIINKFKAEELVVDRWGKKETAYTVGGFKVGNFAIFKFKAGDHNVVTELNRNYRIMDDVIQFQTHLIREKVRKFKGNPNRKVIIEDDTDIPELYA